MSRVVIAMIRAYQYLLSPLFGQSCKFSPSCSEYTAQAITKYGLVKGGRLALWRLLRCNPWNTGGYDPVP